MESNNTEWGKHFSLSANDKLIDVLINNGVEFVGEKPLFVAASKSDYQIFQHVFSNETSNFFSCR